MKKTSKLLSLTMGAVCMFSIAGCAQNNSVPSILPDYDQYEDELRIDIAGWCTPADYSDEQMQLAVDSGVNILHANSAGDLTYTLPYNAVREQDKEFLAQVEKFGLSVYVNLGRDPSALENIDLYAEYDCVRGFQYDEPSTSGEIDEMAKYIEVFNRECNGKTFMVNMMPPNTNIAYDTYSDYVEDIAETITSNLVSKEKWISADYYVLNLVDGEYSLAPAFLGNVEYVAKYGEQYGFKKNYFIQTMPYGGGSHDRVPTYEDIRLQEYALLAFGMDSISLFCYMTPNVNGEFSETQEAMIGRDGKPTPIYDAVKKANQEILSFDHVYLQFDWKGVFTCDAGKTETGKSRTRYNCFSTISDRLSVEDVNSVASVTCSQNTLFGYFGDENANDGFMVVNYNDPHNVKESQVTMEFEDRMGYNKAILYQGGEKTIVEIEKNKLNLDLGAGEGVFVIPYCE